MQGGGGTQPGTSGGAGDVPSTGAAGAPQGTAGSGSSGGPGEVTYLSGAVDDLRVYNRSLNTSETEDLMAL